MGGLDFPPHGLRARPALRVVAASAAAGILLMGGHEPAWSQEKIGGAPIVINNVQGDLAPGNQVPVVQGDNVFLNEAVRSGADSKAKLVLNDNTNVTVGPGSTIKLDNFVYSGPQSSGEITLSMTKGTLRFITGDASKRTYTIWTPTAAIGVRGSIGRIQVTQTETQVINEEGVLFACRRIGDYTAQQILTRYCKGNAGSQATKSCPCAVLLLPNQLATVTSNGIAVTEAPLGAISEPIITEGFAFGGAGLAGAGLVGAAAIGGVVAAVASTSTSSSTTTNPFVSLVP